MSLHKTSRQWVMPFGVLDLFSCWGDGKCQDSEAMGYDSVVRILVSLVGEKL